MTERNAKSAMVMVGVLGAFLLAGLAYARPDYFTSPLYLGGLLLLEFSLAAVWFYRKLFFLLVIVSFLFAGVDLPVGSSWNIARWMVLGLGALAGSVIVLKERRYKFGMFHVLALFAVLAALVSAAVSRYTVLSLLKVLSLALLFLYAATGARLAVAGRENKFFSGLLIACEVFVAGVALSYLLGRELMGNPNSLGAVMGVAAAPILLWGTLLPQETSTRRRRLLFFLISMYLTFASHARASMLAAFVSCAVLCIASHRYRLLAQGIGVIAILFATAAIFQPEAVSRTVASATSSVLFKGKDSSLGLLSSRTSPWQDSMDAIREHFWFGSGFGTSDTGHGTDEAFGTFSTLSTTTAEHGSSYFAITVWVGVLGVLPFLLLLGSLLRKAARTVFWLWKTGNPSHGAVPLAMVIIAGMIHAVFEDWLFAAGYYLCVFYWSMAFVFVDQALSLTIPSSQSIFGWNTRGMRQDLSVATPVR